MTTIGDFTIGDAVRHIGMSEEGQVIAHERTHIRVQYPRKNPTVAERYWYGIYDELWFRLHPDLLVNLSLHESLIERRRQGERVLQQTPGA